MRVLIVTGRVELSARVAALPLLIGALCLTACSSGTGTGWKAQKTYGARMARKGFWREALFRFERAAVEKPDDPEVLNNLAVAYESLGESAKALTTYKRALELAPSDPRIKRNYARFAESYTAQQRAGGAPATPTP